MKKPRNAESRKSFIVTESGIVETDEAPITSTKVKRDPISLLSRSSIPESDTRTSAGSGSGNEDKQAQKPKPLKFNLDDVKSKLNTKRAEEEEEEEKEKRMREKIQNIGRLGDMDDVNASFSGKKKTAIMTQFLVSKAVVLMTTERRKRRENAPSGNLGSLMALSKFKSRVEKRRQSASVNSVDNSGVVNTQILLGLGKFKKSVLKKKTSVDEKPPEPEKMR